VAAIARRSECEGQPPHEKPQIPDEHVPAERVLVHVVRRHDDLAEYERPDGDVDPAPEDERKAGECVRRQQQAGADRGPPRPGQREREQAGGRLEKG
jgi:hypothetical protein